MKYCGIDWANDHHDALSIDEAGRQLESIRVAHARGTEPIGHVPGTHGWSSRP